MSNNNSDKQRKRGKFDLSSISEDMDVTMQDAAMATMHDDGDAIWDKIHRLVLPENHCLVKSSSFRRKDVDTKQLRVLRDAEPHAVDVIGETTTLTKYDIKVDTDRSSAFLDLTCEPERFYVRPGYHELYDYIAACWQSRRCYRVIMLGNAGTGKSWFQVYALMQLMKCDKNERKFDIVIRQVESIFYVIDLEKAEVYWWEISEVHLKVLSKDMEKTLYFFEPGSNGSKSPLDVLLPSLSTLSPNIKRIKQYEKRRCTIVYFWPWSYGELQALIFDAKLQIENHILKDRYHRFGGILRHILLEARSATEGLTDRLSRISIDLLTSQALDIDQDDTKDNISGFLICYDNRSVEGEDRFTKKNLEYTSAYVFETVQAKIRTTPVKEMMPNFLDQLAGRRTDLSGKMLEQVTIELLSHGGTFKWKRKEVGANEGIWEDYAVSKRDVIEEYTLHNNFHQPDKLIAPTQMNFPAIDFVFSWSQATTPVVSFQCTWRPSHKVKLSALYKLRHNHMIIPDDQILEIYMVCPKQEVAYASMRKETFLQDSNPTFSDKSGVSPDELEAMWSNTKIFVLRPEMSWQDHIKAYLEKTL